MCPTFSETKRDETLSDHGTIQAFVDYIPVSLYFALELIFGGTHVTATVFGILRNQQVPPIHLEDGEASNGNVADKDETVEERTYLIPPPGPQDGHPAGSRGGCGIPCR